MKTIIIAISASLLFLCAFLYSRRDLSCNMQVETQNGEIYTVKRINYYQSGFADMHLCNGERVVIQTVIIDTIKTINEK